MKAEFPVRLRRHFNDLWSSHFLILVFCDNADRIGREKIEIESHFHFRLHFLIACSMSRYHNKTFSRKLLGIFLKFHEKTLGHMKADDRKLLSPINNKNKHRQNEKQQ